MKISISTVLLVTLVLVLSVFIANISNLIAVQVGNSLDFYETKDASEVKKKAESHKVSPNIIKNKHSNLMWFLQISDLHVSIFHEASRITQFQEFCERTVDAIKPAVVIATGDLTDAKTADNMGSAQQIEEWEIYKTILLNSNILNKTVWLDIRGNHDNFNIPRPDSSLNYYRDYTIQGRQHPHSYLYTKNVNGQLFGFLGIDACLSPGPKRPFNFVGMLNKTESDHIMHLIDAARSQGVEHTIAFGHYPTSCIISSSGSSARSLIPQAPGCWVYLCGHFHTLGGMVPNMYTLQQNGFLELELGDWKDNRIYRLAAFDHGMFSFTDIRHNTWPVILVTNPKHALYMVPQHEIGETIGTSTHIRVLAFSLSPIILVQVRVDDGGWHNATAVKGPLFTLPWNPALYASGVHRIAVRVRDEYGRERGTEQPFALDGTRLDFRFWPRVALMTNISTLVLFGLALCASTVPLCAMRVAHVLVRRGKMARPEIRSRALRRWVRGLWILCTVDRILYPLVLYALYLSIGPWAVGEIIDGYIGAVFAWGLVVNNSYLPGSFTYAYGFMHMVAFQVPLTCILSKTLDTRFFQLQTATARQSHFDLLLQHFPFLVLICLQMLWAYFFWLAYGTLAFFIGPLRTWSIVLAVVLYRLCNTLPASCLKEANILWTKREESSNSVPLSSARSQL